MNERKHLYFRKSFLKRQTIHTFLNLRHLYTISSVGCLFIIHKKKKNCEIISIIQKLKRLHLFLMKIQACNRISNFRLKKELEMEDSFSSDLNDSSVNIQSPGRSISVASDASMTELPPMVYQLPQPINPTVVVEYTPEPLAPMSPSSSTSSGSGRADSGIDSTTPSTNANFNKNHGYLDDIPVDLQSWEGWNQISSQN